MVSRPFRILRQKNTTIAALKMLKIIVAAALDIRSFLVGIVIAINMLMFFYEELSELCKLSQIYNIASIYWCL